MSWKDTLAKAYTTVPKSWRDLAWKFTTGTIVLSSLLTGFVIYQNPEILIGIPVPRRSPVERLAQDPSIKEAVWGLMETFFYNNRPYGLMFVSWEELDMMVGLWVRPADKFPGKAGIHDLTPDMRVLGGPFLFGECAYTESLAMPGKVMVACPINNGFDAWGYVAAIVDNDPETVKSMMRVLHFLAHRVTNAIYN